MEEFSRFQVAAKASRTLGFVSCNLQGCRKEVRSAAMVQPTFD